MRSIEAIDFLSNGLQLDAVFLIPLSSTKPQTLCIFLGPIQSDTRFPQSIQIVTLITNGVGCTIGSFLHTPLCSLVILLILNVCSTQLVDLTARSNNLLSRRNFNISMLIKLLIDTTHSRIERSSFGSRSRHVSLCTTSAGAIVVNVDSTVRTAKVVISHQYPSDKISSSPSKSDPVSIAPSANGSAKPAVEVSMSSPIAAAKARSWAIRANPGLIASCPALSTTPSTCLPNWNIPMSKKSPAAPSTPKISLGGL